MPGRPSSWFLRFPGGFASLRQASRFSVLSLLVRLCALVSEPPGAPFKKFCSLRDIWAVEDHYCCPGILQYTTGQYSSLCCSAVNIKVQCSTLFYSTVLHSTVQCWDWKGAHVLLRYTLLRATGGMIHGLPCLYRLVAAVLGPHLTLFGGVMVQALSNSTVLQPSNQTSHSIWNMASTRDHSDRADFRHRVGQIFSLGFLVQVCLLAACGG